MSFDQMKKINIEKDDLNIKLHLDTSLDMSGISVSEELINRTMEAIKGQKGRTLESNGAAGDKAEHPIPFTRYTRSLVTVAAAALLLVIGYSAIRGFVPLSSKDETKSFDAEQQNESTEYKIMESAKEAGEADMAAKRADGAADFDAKADADTAKTELYSDEAQLMVEDVVKEEAENSFEAQLTSRDMELPFTDLCRIPYEEITEVTLTDHASNNLVILTDREELKVLYTVLEGYRYSTGDISDGVGRYSILITGKDATNLITLEEERITTEYTQGNNVSQTVYAASDPTGLLQDMEELLQSLR